MIDVVKQNDIEKVKQLLRRGENENADKKKMVEDIVNSVRIKGDGALFEYTRKFDNFDINEKNIKVSEDEFNKAVNYVSDDKKAVIRYAKNRIEKFHKSAKHHSFFIEEDGIILGNRVTAVQKAGLYVPGGKAAYPSTALMTIIPALVAGVKDIYIATCAAGGTVNPFVLYAAQLCGVKDIYKIAGAQAIAAFAYSTESVKKVDVIAGPGNVYVALAKKMVYGDVNIDSVAGPSEVMIVADKNANVEFLSSDLLAQAEHDEMARCYFIGLDKELTKKVEKRFYEMAKDNARNSITKVSSQNAVFMYVEDIDIAAEIVDEVAPEHLELQLDDAYMFMNKINNAGAIFIGEYTPEPVGDYIAGPNHTLPTAHAARFASALSADVFMKKTSIIHYSKKAFLDSAHYAAQFADMEGLYAHKASIEVRYD